MLKKYLKFIFYSFSSTYFIFKYMPNVHNTEVTLKEIIINKKSISRFGDGEIDFILGKGSPSQPYNSELAEKLSKILKDIDKNKETLIAIPFVWSLAFKEYTNYSLKYWGVYLLKNYRKIYKLLDLNYKYYDSQCTRIYINRRDKEKVKQYFDLWKELWNGKDVLVVEGEISRMGVGNDLLNNAKTVQRILCPAKNAYSKYDEIKNAILKNAKNSLVLILLGPTATVLSYELSKIGIQAIDLGNLDIEYEWLKRNLKNKETIQGKYSYETTEENNYELVDEVYNKQIILKIEI